MANLFRCAGGGEALNCIAKPFDPAATYTANDVVLYNGLLYICIAYNVTGEFDSTKWQQTTLEELSGTNPNIFYGIEWLEDEYDSTITYNTDDTCMHAGLLYKCLEDGVTGTWDSSKWERTYLLDCTEMNSNLVKKTIMFGSSPADVKSVLPNIYDKLTSADFKVGITYMTAWVGTGVGSGGQAGTMKVSHSYNPTTGVLTFSAASGKYYDVTFSSGGLFAVYTGTIAGE